MKKHSLLRFGAIAMATAGLAVGVAAASSIDTTGPDSTNKVETKVENSIELKNHNNLGVTNNNGQNATSGEAKAKENTTAGDATSGDATNSNDTKTDVTVSNGGSCSCLSGMFDTSGLGGGDIHLTGPDSNNKIETKVENKLEVHNYNTVGVTNNNEQNASSGDAKVQENTTGGDATSGAASNTNSTETSVSITN